MLGVLVALVKIADYATVIPGMALFVLGVLVFLLAAMQANFDPKEVWERIEWAADGIAARTRREHRMQRAAGQVAEAKRVSPAAPIAMRRVCRPATLAVCFRARPRASAKGDARAATRCWSFASPTAFSAPGPS